MLLNRRHLRIKVLQELYAYYQAEKPSYKHHEKELVKSVEKIHHQYIMWLLLFSQLKHYAENRIEENRNKQLPSEEDLNPNLRFLNNKVFELLSVNKNLRSLGEKHGLTWRNELEMIRKLYAAVRESELYVDYMAQGTRSFEEEVKFASELFRHIIANFELIHHILEEQSIHWVDDIDLVCSMVIKTIKSMTPDADQNFKIFTLYKDKDDEVGFYKTLFRKTIDRDEETAKLIVSKTDNWELDRIAKMDVILMKMAITEAQEFNTIPVKVTLNEYIEISKFYSTPKSNGFINGILDRVFEELKAKGDIKKIGRGLVE